MADSKFARPEDDSEEELVRCGICFAEIDKPKALPCHHSFCLKCLSSWSESAKTQLSHVFGPMYNLADSGETQKYRSKYKVPCPSCREEFSLPDGGVKNLPANFFVSKLKQHRSIKQKLQAEVEIPCTSCTDDVTAGVTVARCLDCKDFLCEKCVTVHRSVRVLQGHKLLTLKEICDGKLAMHKLVEQETCSKHEGNVIRYFCETCDEPMCRDCSIFDHPRPDHKQVELERTAKKRTETLLKLAEECRPVSKQIDSAIETLERSNEELETAFDTAMVTIRETTDTAISTAVKALEAAELAEEDKLKQVKAKRKEEIESHREKLDLMRKRIRTSLKMTHQVTEKGSNYDVATLYSTLTHNMQKASNFKPQAIRASVAKFEFKPRTNLISNVVNHDKLGTLQNSREWPLEKTFSNTDLISPRCVTFNNDGDIAVTDNRGSRHDIKVFARETRQLKLSINTYDVPDSKTSRFFESKPWGLAVSKNGSYYVTDQKEHVKIYDGKGNLKHRFKTKGANDNGRREKSSPMSCLYGLAIDQMGRVYVGGWRSISIHNEDGSHISSFPTKIFPYYITVLPCAWILVSDHATKDYSVHAYDCLTGSHVLTFDKPHGCFSWNSAGICLGSNNDIYVASKPSPASVYRYSMSGRCIGVLVKDLVQPWGIAINKDKDALAIVDQTVVKLFEAQY